MGTHYDKKSKSLLIEDLDSEQGINFNPNNVSDNIAENVHILYLVSCASERIDLRKFRNIQYLRIDASTIEKIYFNVNCNIQQITIFKSSIDYIYGLKFNPYTKLNIYSSCIAHGKAEEFVKPSNLVAIDSAFNLKINEETIKFIERQLEINKNEVNKKINKPVYVEKFKHYDSVSNSLYLYDWYPYGKKSSKYNEFKKYDQTLKNLFLEGDFDDVQNWLQLNKIENAFLYKMQHNKVTIVESKHPINSLFIRECKIDSLDLVDLQIKNPIIIDDTHIENLYIGTNNYLDFKFTNSKIDNIIFVNEQNEIHENDNEQKEFLKNHFITWKKKIAFKKYVN